MAPFVCGIFPRASLQNFWRGFKGCLGSVWRVSWGWVVESILTLSEGGGMVSAGCLDYVWMVSGSVFWVTICVLSSLGHNQAKKLHLSSAVFSHKLHSRIFWEVLKVVWIVSGSVWRVSLDCLVESTLRQVIPTTKRLLYKSTVFSTSAPSQHFSRVAEWCLEGVWRMSEGCMRVCSEWLWLSSQSFVHKYAWSSPKTRIEGTCFFLCPFSQSALRAQKGTKIQKVMLLWPAFFLTKTWWSFRQSDLFLCIGLGLGGHESNFWPCVLCPPPNSDKRLLFAVVKKKKHHQYNLGVMK